MLSYIYHLFVFNPLYNGFIFIFDKFPWIDAGFVVIIFTIIVRLILFPISKKAVITQLKMKEIQPELDTIKATVTDKQQQALKIMDLYKKKGVNPFSSIFLLFIQLPIIFSLYGIFTRSGLPTVNESILYSFVAVPVIKMSFLGIFDISSASIFLSILAAVSQFLQLHYSLATTDTTTRSSNESVNAAQDMMKYMKYILPVVIFIFTYTVSSVIALYITTTNLFTLGQELVIRRHLKKHQPL